MSLYPGYMTKGLLGRCRKMAARVQPQTGFWKLAKHGIYQQRWLYVAEAMIGLLIVRYVTGHWWPDVWPFQ
jgi:hypothetical protein